MNELSRVMIVDDHPLFRDALATAIKLAYPGTEALEVDSVDAALDALEVDRDYDIALLDLNIPGVHGFDGLLRLRTYHPQLPVLIVSGLEASEIIGEAIHYGAAGYLPKSLGREVLSNAIDMILAGGVYVPDDFQSRRPESTPPDDLVERLLSLTPQQLRVLSMLREGLLNKQIAHELDVGDTTVKKHVSEILRKLRVNSRTQAVIEVSRVDDDRLFDVERRLRDPSPG